MKYIKLVFIILLLSGCSIHKENKELDIDIENIIEEKEEYIDDNPIKLGIFPANGNYHGKEVIIDEYYAPFNSGEDIGSFEVFLTGDTTVDGNNFKDTWNKYYNNYLDIDKYKVGFNITYTLKDGEEDGSNFLEPDNYRYGDYFYVYLYDDVNAPDGFYSHLEEMEDNTILSSIKIYATDNISDIEYITLTAFTYDEDDMDENNNYRGISKYQIKIKRK